MDKTENRKPMERVLYEVKKTIVGQDHLLERLVVALLARGHILVEGVPGLAKTLAIKALAESIGISRRSVQTALAHLLDRRLIRQRKARPTAVPVYTVLTPWIRKRSSLPV